MQKKAIAATFLIALMLVGNLFLNIRVPMGEAASPAGIYVAITKGLMYLASIQKPDGSWPGPYGEDAIATTAMAVLALENAHHLPDNASDPYHTIVANGLHYLLSQAQVQVIGPRPAGNPDTNGNGIGIYFDDFIDGSVSCYETPMVLMALVASQNASRVATTGPVNVTGRSYHDIVTDIVDWLAWSQNDNTTGIYEGGWRYHPFYGSSDMSVTQWAVLGLLTAELWNINGPSWVQKELAKWLAVDQDLSGNSASNYFYGCFYYEPNNQLDDVADSAAGILGLTYCGVNSTDPRIVAAEGYITRDWYTTQGTGGWRNNFGDFYVMYSIMKTMELTLPFPTKYIENYAGAPTIEWYNGTNQYADWLIANQHSDGSWLGTNNPEEGSTGQNLDTAWGVLILEHIPVVVKYPLMVQVIDAYNGNPIAAANVSAVGPENQSEITNIDGLVFFNESQAGSYLISASKVRYITAEKKVDLTQTEYVTIELAQTGPFKLKVSVVNSCNQPIRNALVKVANTTANTTAVSDTSGVASFNLPRGFYTVTASHSFYEQSSSVLDLTANESITLTLGFPYVFKGQIAKANMIINATSSGYGIRLLNNLTSSSMDVFFEWDYMGTIPAGSWQTFNFNHLPNLIVEAASGGSPDYPNAWYANPVPIQLPPINGTEGAFLPEPVPYVATSIFVNPYPPVYGENVTIGVTLHNPLNHPLHISRVDFQLSGLTVGGYFSSIGFINNVTLQVNEISDFSIVWLANVSGHHCVRVVLTYSPNSQTAQRNLDIENNVIAGGVGQVSFTLTNPSQTSQQMVIRANETLPIGWKATLEINDAPCDMSHDIFLNMTAGEVANALLTIESNSTAPGEGIVDIKGYMNGASIGGIRKIMQTAPPSALAVIVTAGNGGSVTVHSSAINSGVPVTVNGGNTESWSVMVGSYVQLNATPSQGYLFTSWNLTNGMVGPNGVALNASSPTITAFITGVSSFQANFKKPRQLTTTVVAFSANPIAVGAHVTCTAIVSGLNPVGTVTWSTSSTTGYFSQSACVLYLGKCSTTYTDISPGVATITASYSGDANNSPSSGSASLSVGGPTIQIAFFDDFRKDKALNTGLWGIDSAVLSAVAEKEGAYFAEGVALKAPELPIAFSSSGMAWSASGVAALSGLTTQAAFTPPFTLQANVTLTSAIGGNPVVLYLSNENATTLFAVYLGNSIWISDQAATPYQGPGINENTMYTVTLNVSISEVTVTLTSTSQIFTYTAPLTQSGDYALYASIGSFAGQVPGEAGRSTYSDSSAYASLMISSTHLHDLIVHVDASIGGNSSPKPSTGALVEVTNRITQQTFTDFTDSSGDCVFTSLVTGGYLVGANQSGTVNGFPAHPFNSTSILIGNPSDPSRVSLNTTLDILTPPLEPLSVTLSPTSTVGIFPLSVNFTATPGGYVENYTVTWFINGTQVIVEGMPLQGEIVDINNFTKPGHYLVSAQVASQGKWFGVPEPLETSLSSEVSVIAKNAVCFAKISPINDQGLIQLNYNDTYQGQIFFDGNDVYLNTTVKNELAAVDIPDVIQTILGISCPYFGIDFSDSTRTSTVSTNQVEQPYATSDVYSVMPQGTPTNYKSLTNYDFFTTLNPSNGWALLYNGVTVFLAALGVISSLPTQDKDTLLKILQDALVTALDEKGTFLSLDIMRLGAIEVLKNLVDFITHNFQTLEQSLITLLRDLGLDIIVDVIASLTGAALFRAVLDFTWDLCTVIGAIVRAALTTSNVQEFTFANVVPGEVITVDPDGVLPFVTLSGSNMLAGWQGNWIGPSGAFIHSAIVDGMYSFAVPYGNYTLEIATPPGVSDMNYNISIAINGVTQMLNGTVRAGSPLEYTITYENGSITAQMCARSMLREALYELQSLLPTGSRQANKRICDAIQHLNESLESNLWVDDSHLNPKHGTKVFDEDDDAVANLEEILQDHKVAQAVRDKALAIIKELAEADGLLADTAIKDAKALGSTDPRVVHEITEAEKEFSEAMKDFAKGHYLDAIEDFKEAWTHAERALAYAQYALVARMCVPKLVKNGFYSS